MSFRIHIPAVPHTRPTAAWSHCAFTTKARLLPKLLKLVYPDAEIVWYGVGDDQPPGCHTNYSVLSDARWSEHFDAAATAAHRFVGEQAHVDHPGYVAFNRALAHAWALHVKHGDLMCFPFGHAHQAAAQSAIDAGGLCVETGIGYPTPFLPFRIYESRAWLHYVAGKSGCEGSDYHFVAPHYYDLAEWPSLERVSASERRGIVYVGRLIESKGLAVLKACAEAMPDETFTLYGQGDPSPWLRENVVYGGTLDREGVKQAFLGAKAALFPTRYIEPFCQAHIEALLCGCPVVASDFGVFPETAEAFDWRGVHTARTLPDFVFALGVALGARVTRPGLASRARQLYGIDDVAPFYRHHLDQIRATATPQGWFGQYHPTSALAATE